MKTFNIFIISLGIAGALSMSSCSNFLKEDPYSYVGIDDVGNDDDAVNLWVTGVYSKWLDDMARWGNFPRLLDMDCDYVSGPDWAFSNLGAGNFQGDEVPTGHSPIWVPVTFRVMKFRILYGTDVTI